MPLTIFWKRAIGTGANRLAQWTAARGNPFPAHWRNVAIHPAPKWLGHHLLVQLGLPDKCTIFLFRY